MTPRTALVLGRVSNLPTVWTNALAGAVLAGAVAPDAGAVVLAGIALTLFYLGGMWLNDAFDAEIDAAERAARPIPSGRASRKAVFAGGAGMLVLGLAVVWLSPAPLLAGVLLAGTVVLYDWLHKRTVFSPVIMGAARFLSYALAALAVGSFAGAPVWGAVGLFAWVAGLTYAAKQEAHDSLGNAWPLAVLAVPLLYAGLESLGDWLAFAIWTGLAYWTAVALRRLFRRAPGDVPKAVVGLIAGIALYDAVLIAAEGAWLAALAAVAAFALTLFLQRWVPGT